MVNPNLLPPPPVRTNISDKNGLISPIWMTWFTQFYTRVGGAISAPSEDVAILNAYNDINSGSDSVATSITGILKGTGTVIAAATAGTDYSDGTAALGTGILKSTTATGALTIAVSGDFPTLNQNTSGNAATATALATARAIGGVNFDGTAAIVPQTIQSVNEGTDTTCFPLFISASGSQSLQPLNNTALTFNASTGALGATSFSGAGTSLTGTAASLTAGIATVANGWNTGVVAVPSFHAYSSSDTTLAANTFTKINLNAEEFDVGGWFDSTTNKRYTPLRAGIYVFSGAFDLTNPALLTTYAIALYKNGALVKYGNLLQSTVTTGLAPALPAITVSMNGSTDYVELFGFNGHATNTATATGTQSLTYFSGYYVGPST